MPDAGETPDWLEQLADAALTSSAPSETEVYLPALDRKRHPRAPLVPRGVLIGAAIGLAVIAAAVGLVLWLQAGSLVAAPSVIGLAEGDARVTARRAGLELVVLERRFSRAPEGQVIEQSPAPGTEIRRSDPLKVVLSAGTEEFVLPDVVGQGLALAAGTLEAKGLFVDVAYVVSDAPSDTVLSSIPAPGATVRTGDRVRLEVSSPRDATLELRPYLLEGLVVVIDPSPAVPGLSNDPTLEVGRRLRSLLEASGASVRLLRSGTDTSTAVQDRKMRARESTYTVGVGISVAAGGAPGLAVSSATSLTASLPTSSSLLASKIASALPGPGSPRRSDVAFDEVFGASESLWVRVTLGSSSSRDDVMSFIDPRWADTIARAIYSAMGETFGTLETP